MAHDWQNWKSIVLRCHCHKVYRVEAIGLKSSKYTLTNGFVSTVCKISVNFMKNVYLFQ